MPNDKLLKVLGGRDIHKNVQAHGDFYLGDIHKVFKLTVISASASGSLLTLLHLEMTFVLLVT